VGRWFHDIAVRHGGSTSSWSTWPRSTCHCWTSRSRRARRYSHEHTRRWSKTVSAGRAYVFVVPEYNHSYTPATKNALTFLDREWRDKPVGSSATADRRRRGDVQALIPVVTALGHDAAAESCAHPMINRALAADGRSPRTRGAKAAPWTCRRPIAAPRHPGAASPVPRGTSALDSEGNDHRVALEPGVGHRGCGPSGGP